MTWELAHSWRDVGHMPCLWKEHPLNRHRSPFLQGLSARDEFAPGPSLQRTFSEKGLETFLVVTTEVCYWHLVGRDQ